MKLLFIYSDMIKIDGILWGLLELGHEVEIYPSDITIQNYVTEEADLLHTYLADRRFDAAITYNFSPMLSDVCQNHNIKYLSWVFDSPQIDLHTKQYYNDCNYIFVFDRKYCGRLEQRPFDHLYYMPLGANLTKTAGLEVSKADEDRFAGDVSFVGNLYEDNMWNTSGHLLPDQIRDKIQRRIEERVFRWNRNETIFGLLTEEDCIQIKQTFHLTEYVDLDLPYYMENHFMVRKMAELERVVLLNALAERHQVHLYTRSSPLCLKGVMVHPEVSYSEEAPKIFHLSKINLNITLRSIETGVPQRVFDIMSVGGFVLSNYQEELETLFVPNEELVFFHSLKELMELIEYYLNHEEERVQIAMKGYQRVRDQYSCPVLLDKMLRTVNGEVLE